MEAAVQFARLNLFGNFVVAGFAARRTIVKSVMTQAHVYLALTEAAVFFAIALSLDRFALHTNVFFGSSGARAHSI
jgi:hypothetical protein